MRAERLLLETDQSGRLKDMPKLPANTKIEAIFLVLDSNPELPRRAPHSDLAGAIKFKGQVLGSIPEADWNLPS